MKKVYIRWLGAFAGRQYSLKESIKYEILRKDEAACERVGNGSGVAHKGQIGLILKEDAIFRNFKWDCWSYYGGDQAKHYSAKPDQDPHRLYTTEPNRRSNHNESWAHMEGAVYGIVVYGMNVWQLTQDRRNTILNAAARYKLAVYRFTHGQLQKEEL